MSNTRLNQKKQVKKKQVIPTYIGTTCLSYL